MYGPDRISLTTHHLHMCYEETDKVLSSGTGFVVKHEDGFYMITIGTMFLARTLLRENI